MRCAVRIIATALATFTPPHSGFATENDLNIWLAQTASINAGDKAVIWLEAQERFTNDASRLGQLLLRPALGYKLDGSTTAFIGYGYVLTDPEGPPQTNEHRVFQQLSFRLLGDGKGTTLTARTRLEQRWLEEQPGTGWRLRQQVRLTTPVADKLTGVVWTEPFIGFNETGFQRSGIGVWRNFVGVSLPLGKAVKIEPGYLNQYVVRSGDDRIDHVISLTANANF